MNEAFRQRIIEANRGMEGWATADKACAMAELILTSKPQVVVEIGVFGGRSLIPQAMALRENNSGMVYGIDAWKKDVAIEGVNDQANDDWWAKLDLEGIHRSCVEHIWRNGLDTWCCLIRSPSQNCKHLWQHIDILHIDGNHSEVSSVRDVENYLPLVKPGGYVWFDDVNWATTQRALAMVKEQGEDCGTIGKGTGTECTLFRKR